MSIIGDLQSYLCERRGQAHSYCSRCLAETLVADIGDVIQAMQSLKEGGRYIARWGTCHRCFRPWVYVINTTVLSRGDAIEQAPIEPEQGDSNV